MVLMCASHFEHSLAEPGLCQIKHVFPFDMDLLTVCSRMHHIHDQIFIMPPVTRVRQNLRFRFSTLLRFTSRYADPICQLGRPANVFYGGMMCRAGQWTSAPGGRKCRRGGRMGVWPPRGAHKQHLECCRGGILLSRPRAAGRAGCVPLPRLCRRRPAPCGPILSLPGIYRLA